MKDNISVFCNCGCDNGFRIRFRFEGDDDLEYVYMSTITSGFVAHQIWGLHRMIRRIRAAWFMLRGKEYLLHDIVLTKEQWNDFVKTVNEVKLQ